MAACSGVEAVVGNWVDNNVIGFFCSRRGLPIVAAKGLQGRPSVWAHRAEGGILFAASDAVSQNTRRQPNKLLWATGTSLSQHAPTHFNIGFLKAQTLSPQSLLVCSELVPLGPLQRPKRCESGAPRKEDCGKSSEYLKPATRHSGKASSQGFCEFLAQLACGLLSQATNSGIPVS